ISGLTNQGKLRFMIYEGALKAPIFLDFLRRLVREAARKLFVVVDNLPVHRAHRVTAWVHDHADRIELCYLPSYAPEHNPDEFLNNDLKRTMAFPAAPACLAPPRRLGPRWPRKPSPAACTATASTRPARCQSTAALHP